jgi:hypothetical protein
VIGQFGHCNQELINLLLTGRATSNVIDGEMELGDSGLRLRGVYQRSSIGYLTQLEALRYCEVRSGALFTGARAHPQLLSNAVALHLA